VARPLEDQKLGYDVHGLAMGVNHDLSMLSVQRQLDGFR
jgi:hypothetical protein